MRMEELSDSRYEKGTDSVEKYLLNIVQSYFKNQNISSPQSRETIIKKAVARMKEEVDFESIGVLSITLPDGQKRIGAVQISLEDLGGEPIIQDKKTAFNVHFGQTANTACEGNDPRLSDSREPLPHTHNVSEILNLASEITALQGKIDRLVFHEHTNAKALDVVRYTGSKPVVDLKDIETLQANIDALLANLQNMADAYNANTSGAISAAQDSIQRAHDAFATLQAQVDTQGAQYRLELEDEMNAKLTDVYSQIDAKFADYATSTDMTTMQTVMLNAITMYGTSTVYMADVLAVGGRYKVDDGIPLEIQSLGPHMEPIVDAHVIINGKKAQVPYFVTDSSTGTINAIVTIEYDGQEVYVVLSNVDNPAPELLNASVQISYSVKGA